MANDVFIAYQHGGAEMAVCISAGRLSADWLAGRQLLSTTVGRQLFCPHTNTRREPSEGTIGPVSAAASRRGSGRSSTRPEGKEAA